MNASNEEEVSESFSFGLHLTSKIPYSFDTHGILSTLACGIHHGQLKTTTGKATMKERALDNNQDKKYNTKKHLKVNNFYSRRRVLRVKLSHE